MYDAPRMGSAGLQARAAVENNHYVLAQVPGLVFLTLPQSFASRHHEHDRDDPPRNSEHGEKCP
jgi:predicted flavoprotein YhiN